MRDKNFKEYRDPSAILPHNKLKETITAPKEVVFEDKVNQARSTLINFLTAKIAKSDPYKIPDITINGEALRQILNLVGLSPEDLKKVLNSALKDIPGMEIDAQENLRVSDKKKLFAEFGPGSIERKIVELLGQDRGTEYGVIEISTKVCRSVPTVRKYLNDLLKKQAIILVKTQTSSGTGAYRYKAKQTNEPESTTKS